MTMAAPSPILQYTSAARAFPDSTSRSSPYSASTSTPGLPSFSVDKDAAAIVVTPKLVWDCASAREGLFPHQDPRRPSPRVATVVEAPEGAAAADAGKEGQLPGSHHLQLGVADFKLALLAAIVTSRRRSPGTHRRVARTGR